MFLSKFFTINFDKNNFLEVLEMSGNPDNKTFEGQEIEKKEAYFDAKKTQYAAEARPSKLSEWPIVGFVEVNGSAYPLYRATE